MNQKTEGQISLLSNFSSNKIEKKSSNPNNNLEIERLKQDESAFRELVGNIPERYGIAFNPTGLNGDSWTFFKSEEGFFLLQRKSNSEVLDIVGYAKEIGLSIEELKVKFPRYLISKSSAEILQSWLSSHGLTKAEIKEKGWIVSETEIKYPIQTEDGIKYQTRKLGAEHKERFYSDKGLKTSQYFYTPAQLKGSKRLIICAGASDCLNAYLAFEGKVDCVGVLGEGIIPKKLLELKYDEFVIAYDSDEAGKQSAIKLASRLKNSKIVNWSLFPNTKDLSELAAKREREAIISLINSAVDQTIEPQHLDWPELKPFPNPLKPVLPFDLDFLPVKLQPFISDIAERLQCPIDFTAAALIVVLSSALGRRLGIKPKEKDNWIVIPNLWGMIIGRPSVMKTPSMKQPMSLLEYYENEFLKEYEKTKEEYDRNKLVYDAMESQKKKEISDAVKQGLDAFALVKENSEIPEEPKSKRLIANDSTVEKLGELISTNPFGLLYFRDELYGFIKSFEKEGHETDRAFYLEGWCGDGRYTVDRIGRGTTFIEAICISILGGIQPGKLQNLVKQAIQGQAGDDGLLQRFQLAVWPDDIKEWKNVDKYPNNEAKEEVRDLVRSFLSLESRHPNAQTDKFNPVPFLSFDRDAQLLFFEWLTENENKVREKELHPAVESHLGKYKSLIPSLALIFQLAKDINSSAVGLESLSRALAYSEYLKSHAIRIYESVLVGEVQSAKALLRKIKKGELGIPFTAREIQQKGWAGLNTSEMTKSVLDLLEDLNYLRCETKTTTGRPTSLYFVNPRFKGGECE